MQLRFNYRVYPTPGQQIELARAFGCARVVFNDGLRLRRQARDAHEKYISDSELSRRLITEAKLTPERAWLGEVSAVVLQQALADLNTAYRNFFNSITGKRKGRKVAPPRLRSRKDNQQAIRFTKNSRFKVLDNGRLRLPKVGDLEVRWSWQLPSDPSSVTIIKDAAGRYFASFVVQTGEDETLPPVDSEVGIDLGLTHFAVLSDGTKVAAPKFLRRAARKLCARLTDVLAGTEGARLESLRVGQRSMPADGLTVAGFLGDSSKIYAIATHSGITLGPLLGKLAAQELLTGSPAEVLAGFRPQRLVGKSGLPTLKPARFAGQQ
ncbi:RNA-guided endonuclease TnpB family protein [Saccharopolyspora hattusasensis]|uniref:RNA-guided endonuclease InsQ/TnpB family protein n=1 Tax=Saccharopolyspora hattusasensis TaxID=1128679 RepID=UPI003D95C9E0